FYCRSIIQGKKFSNIEAKSNHRLFIDKDIDMPGINLTLNAPQWQVVGRKTISLKGKNANNHLLQKAPSGINENSQKLHGEDGQQGFPGNNGGDFCGIGE